MYDMMEEDPLLVSRQRPFSSRVNLRRAESAEEVVELESLKDNPLNVEGKNGPNVFTPDSVTTNSNVPNIKYGIIIPNNVLHV